MELKCIKSAQILQLVLYGVCILWILLCFASCTKENLSDCDTTLYIKAINASGDDITSSGEVGISVLYIFDKEQKFVEQRTISADDIENRNLITLPLYNFGNFWVVVWSNLNEKQQVKTLDKGIKMQEALVQLKRDEQGYGYNPDDLFYGITKVSYNTIENNVLIIRRKTALVNILVRGLSPTSDDEYHFIIRGAKLDAYNFKGDLTGNSIEYRQNGEFNSQNTIFMSNAFAIFPLAQNDNLSILIYRGDQLVAIVDSIEGKPIVPVVGITSNILVDLTASLNVNIKITDWDTVYHWFEW